MTTYTYSEVDRAMVAEILQRVGREPGAWPEDAATAVLDYIGPVLCKRAIRHAAANLYQLARELDS